MGMKTTVLEISKLREDENDATCECCGRAIRKLAHMSNGQVWGQKCAGIGCKSDATRAANRSYTLRKALIAFLACGRSEFEGRSVVELLSLARAEGWTPNNAVLRSIVEGI